MKTKRISNGSGQVMIITIIIFLGISMIITFGLANPVLRHAQEMKNIKETKQGFYLSEAGMEDVIYRLRNGIQTGSVNTLSLDGYTAETSVTDTENGKNISSVGDYKNFVRTLEAKLTMGTIGASFFYGLQTGTGGINMSNNAIVNGNVYANGNIFGSNGAKISGSAIAANTATITPDQINNLPSSPLSAIQFGKNSSTEDLAQSFTVSETDHISKVAIFIRKVSTPGNLTVRIVSDNAGSPSSNTLAQATLSAPLVTANFGWIELSLSANPELMAEQTYWIVLDGGNSSSRYYEIASNDAYENGLAKTGKFGGTWINTNPSDSDVYFKVFMGGSTSKIDNIIVGSGTIGDAYANTVINSNIAGSLFCQNGSGNNKTCDSSKSDPNPIGFPISEGNTEEWKNAALAGGETNGDVLINDDSTSLGPRKINGNLSLINNAILNVTGTLWVTGDVIISNGSVIRLSASYGQSSGVIITNGTVSISNNANFNGSGQTGSYILLITTNEGANAVNVSNNAGAVILNAQNGTINFANNAGAKSAVAKQINLSNGSFINYESGLVNVNFSSGPSGGFDISNWKETE